MDQKSEFTFDPKAYLATANHGRTAARYLAGQTIFSRADPADAVFYIQAGRVKLVAASERGVEAVVAIYSKGEFFGEACLLAQPLRSATAIAMGECDVMRVEKAEMVRVLRAEPALAEFFMAHMLRRMVDMKADLADLVLH